MKEEVSFILVYTLIGLAVSIGIVTLVLVCRIDDRVGELMIPLTNAKKPKNLRFIQLDEIGGNCPLCDRTVRFAQKHCHNCTQLLDWSEAVTWSVDDDEEDKWLKGNLHDVASYKQVTESLKINGFSEKLARNLQQKQVTVK